MTRQDNLDVSKKNSRRIGKTSGKIFQKLTNICYKNQEFAKSKAILLSNGIGLINCYGKIAPKPEFFTRCQFSIKNFQEFQDKLKDIPENLRVLPTGSWFTLRKKCPQRAQKLYLITKLVAFSKVSTLLVIG